MKNDTFNVNEWAEETKTFWDKAEKDGIRLPVIDNLVRHKWPEEKPEHGKEYLVYSKDREYGCTAHIVAEWKDYLTDDECHGPYGDIWKKDEPGWYYYGSDLYLTAVDGVEYYWNLPKGD